MIKGSILKRDNHTQHSFNTLYKATSSSRPSSLAFRNANNSGDTREKMRLQTFQGQDYRPVVSFSSQNHISEYSIISGLRCLRFFRSLISLLHYHERQRLINAEVLECYQIALQTAGASATAPLRAHLCPSAPRSQQHACAPLAPLRRPGSEQRLHLLSSFQPLLFLPGARQSPRCLRCSITDFMMVLHKEKEDQHLRMEQTFAAVEHEGIILPCRTALSVLH